MSPISVVGALTICAGRCVVSAPLKFTVIVQSTARFIRPPSSRLLHSTVACGLALVSETDFTSPS